MTITRQWSSTAGPSSLPLVIAGFHVGPDSDPLDLFASSVALSNTGVAIIGSVGRSYDGVAGSRGGGAHILHPRSYVPPPSPPYAPPPTLPSPPWSPPTTNISDDATIVTAILAVTSVAVLLTVISITLLISLKQGTLTLRSPPRVLPRKPYDSSTALVVVQEPQPSSLQQSTRLNPFSLPAPPAESVSGTERWVSEMLRANVQRRQGLQGDIERMQEQLNKTLVKKAERKLHMDIHDIRERLEALREERAHRESQPNEGTDQTIALEL